MRRTIGAFAVWLLVFGACAARAQDLDKAMLLVATPALQGPYAGTALVVVPVGDRHFGFILNRSSGVHLAKLFPEHAPSAKVVDPIYFGGPEVPTAIFAVRHGDPGEPSIRLFGDLYMTGHTRVIDRVIETTPNEARYFAGYVGWEPQELAEEVKAGAWYVAEPDEAQVLRRDTDTLWEELVKRFGKPAGEETPAGRAMQQTLLELPIR